MYGFCNTWSAVPSVLLSMLNVMVAQSGVSAVPDWPWLSIASLAPSPVAPEEIVHLNFCSRVLVCLFHINGDTA